jgi:hypothetical protein
VVGDAQVALEPDDLDGRSGHAGGFLRRSGIVPVTPLPRG